MDKPPIRVIIEALYGGAHPDVVQVGALYSVAERVLQALIDAGHMPLPNCGDCGVEPGQPHVRGCCVARCKLCGWQDIGDHHCKRKRPSTIWTGRWPGKDEVGEYGLDDLNQLASFCGSGLMKWDSAAERWVRNPKWEQHDWDCALQQDRDFEQRRKKHSTSGWASLNQAQQI